MISRSAPNRLAPKYLDTVAPDEPCANRGCT